MRWRNESIRRSANGSQMNEKNRPCRVCRTPSLCMLYNTGLYQDEIHPRTNAYNIYTLRISLSRQASPFSPPTGSFTHPASVPTFLLKALSRSLPYTLPFGSTTGSFSTMLLVWCAYGTFRASSLSSVLHIGHTVVVDDEALAEEDV